MASRLAILLQAMDYTVAIPLPLQTSPMDDHLLDILVCPISKGRLQYDRARQELVSVAEKLAFPIRDGIPILLESEARRLDAPENATNA